MANPKRPKYSPVMKPRAGIETDTLSRWLAILGLIVATASAAFTFTGNRQAQKDYELSQTAIAVSQVAATQALLSQEEADHAAGTAVAASISQAAEYHAKVDIANANAATANALSASSVAQAATSAAAVETLSWQSMNPYVLVAEADMPCTAKSYSCHFRGGRSYRIYADVAAKVPFHNQGGKAGTLISVQAFHNGKQIYPGFGELHIFVTDGEVALPLCIPPSGQVVGLGLTWMVTPVDDLSRARQVLADLEENPLRVTWLFEFVDGASFVHDTVAPTVLTLEHQVCP